MLVFAAAPDLSGAFPLALLLGFASVSFMTVSTAIVQVRARPAMRGRVIALQSMLLLGSTPIGGPLLGAICDAYGARAGLVVGGVAALVAAGWGFLKGRGFISYRTPARSAHPLLDEPEPAGAETA
jgi:MFS family permease